ncbi:restriction endonuclease (plasmid) [Streptosporangium sp. CA-135522]|uniref:restriction endonuclease n=1 Tax=Streptosporangium sp. CA-135522 TaxID=3240072 RepID=UPI003D8A977F
MKGWIVDQFSRLPHPRMPSGIFEWIAAGVFAGFAGLLSLDVIRTVIGLIFGHWYITVTVAGCAVIGAGAWQRWRRMAHHRRTERLSTLRLSLADLDAMGAIAFEYATRDLMIRDGIKAWRVGQRGDQAADVIGRDCAGEVIVVQCKHTTTGNKVGAPVIYQVNGTASPIHGADIAVVVTNGAFTRDARQCAQAFRIHLIGREDLARWAEDGITLYQLLRLSPPLRRWRRLRHTAPRLTRHPPRRDVSGVEHFG